VALGPVVARTGVLVHGVSRTEELAERRRAHSFDHAGLEEHRAWYVLATRGLEVKHADAVAQHLLKLGANLVTALARLHVRNLAQRNSLEAGSTREKKGGEERRNLRNSVWQFGTGIRKCRWHARVYPEQEYQVILPLLPLEIWAPC